MARSIWTGSISFGLVNIPVGLYSAVEEKTIRFHQLERGTSDRIRYKRVNERTEQEVDYENIVKGYEVSDDQYIVLSPKELEAVEPSGSRTVEIEDFVDQQDIDPIFYDRTYYLAPRNEAAIRPYALLRDAMRKAGRVGIASFVMRGKEHLAAIRVDREGEVIVLETMFFANEIREPQKELDLLPGSEAPKERELSMAVNLIESMTAKWEPDKYHDLYRERVMELIDQKRRGEEVVFGTKPRKDTNVVDLMEALRRSVERVRGGESAAPPADETLAGEAPAKTAASPKRAAKPADRKRPSSEQLSMLSKEELYQLAQTLDVPGRSKMSRRELELAVSKARPEDEAPPKRSARRAS